MIDPVSAMAVAGTAFSAIKKGIQLGKDVESMYGDIGRWNTINIVDMSFLFENRIYFN